MSTHVDAGAVEGLRPNFAGGLLHPDDEGYDEARRIWNGHIDRRPAIIAQCSGPADVAAAVRFARERDLLVSVRGGGHAVAGHAVCDHGVMIDLSQMTGARVDPLTSTIRVQGGCLQRPPRPGEPGLRSGHDQRDRQPHRGGRSDARRWHRPPHAQVRPLHRQPPLVRRRHRRRGDAGCQRGPEPRPVLGATGWRWQLRHCDVVRVPAPPARPHRARRHGGLADGPGPAVLRLLRDLAAEAPDELGVTGNLRLAPPLPMVPEALHGKPIVALLLCWAGAVEDGEAALRPARELGPPVMDVVSPKPYVAFQKMIDPAVPHGLHYY